MTKLYTPKFSFGKWLFLFAGGFILYIFLYYFVMLPEFLMENKWLSSALFSVAGVLLLLIYRWLSKAYEDREVKELATGKALKHTGIGFLWGMAFIGAVVAIFALCGWYKVEGFYFNAGWLFWFLMSYFVVAAGEEIILRGIVFRLLYSQFNAWAAIAVSASVFGILHIGNPNATLVGAVGITVASGILFALLFMYYKTLWVPIGMHWSWNFVQGTVFGCPVSGEDSGYSIIRSSTSGPELFTGGAFGPEASVITMVLGIALSIWVVMRLCGKRNCI